MVPRLFYERLDDFGIDFACSTPRSASSTSANPDEELRRAVRPRGEPDERGDVRARIVHRIAPGRGGARATRRRRRSRKRTYAVRELGLKVIMIANHVKRPVPGCGARRWPIPRTRARCIDSLALRERPTTTIPFWADVRSS